VQYNLNSLTEVITFDEEGVCVSFTGVKHCMRNNPVVQIDVNDANWHEVVFTWSSSTGLIVTVDSVVVIRNMTYALGLTLPPFGWFVLGGEYDLDRRAAVVGQGFQGYLSKLTVFNRVFPLADIPGIGTDRFNDDRILLWGDYRLNRGCVRTGSSTVGTTPCRPGFVGPTCDPQPDVTPLTITCPADVHLVTSTRSKSAEWADPVVNGAYKSLTPSMMKGQTLAWGRHKVTYRVEDFAGNVAFCSFKIFVRYGCTGLSDDGVCYSASTVTAVHSDVNSGCSRQYGLNTAPASAQLLQKLREHLTSRNASGDFYWLDAKWDGMSFKDAGGNTVTVAGSELASALGGALPTSGNEGMCLALSRSDGFKVTVQNCSSKAHYICSSDITSGNCETPAPIKNGVWECSDGGSQCRQCKVKCNPNYAVPRRIPEYFSCGPLGYWGSARTPSATFRVPSCTLKSDKRVRVYVRIRIQVPGPLSTQQANAIMVAIRGLIRSHFVVLNNLWNNLWCYITDCSRKLSENNITVMQRSSARRRKRQSTSEFDVTFSVGDLPEMMNNTGGNETLTPLQILLRDALQQNGFNFNNDIAGSVTLPDQTVITSEPSCGPGQTLVGTSCVDCAEGTYYNSLTQTCDDCPVGQFQNMTSQTSCMMCPGGGTTDGAGSTSVADCKISCPAGSYFSKVSGSCRLCPVSYYQEQTGQFSCDPCPVDKVTRDPGADNSSMCFDDCPSGSELDDQGQCVSCPRGYYRQQGVQLRCTECPANFITPGNGSITVAECTVPDCQPGSYIDSNTCTACDNGFYQPEKWQTSCISCGDSANWRTDQIGSTMQSQCKYYCPSGYEVQNFTCVACPVGTYKDISSGNYYGMCDPCPNNKVTEQDTSISVDNCTISNCSAGYASYEDGSGCYPCPRGTYQPESLQRQCLQCINRTMYTTLDEANTSPSACTKFCPSGHEIMTDGTCRPCERGLYKDNLVGPDFELNRCTACPPGVVTDIGVTAATNASICTFLACDPGYYYLKPANACEPCLKGAYQPNKWQAQCLQCQSGETTTGTGSINETQCLKYCP
ncbi:sushi, von Willebrand factor type A, EGF and pentraxin domain-containing protein 1-like, partial [Lingula anatina]|uniref:Sushi, von Willebrand factor type A, EGF and pentraxin domain-containing protein 1-like n=1 Tax=Lingula anatina TaxID=7574 RepID=A0A2R2MLS0_LINAN